MCLKFVQLSQLLTLFYVFKAFLNGIYFLKADLMFVQLVLGPPHFKGLQVISRIMMMLHRCTNTRVPFNEVQLIWFDLRDVLVVALHFLSARFTAS